MSDSSTKPESRLPTETRIEEALMELERVKPAPDLSARIIAALPAEAKNRNRAIHPWLGVTTLLAAMIGFALAYQTAFTLRTNGAFELVSYYATQPEIVSTYPDQAWNAFAGMVPWMTVMVGLVMLSAALFLMYRLANGLRLRVLG